jgi:small subunit ribosomal protein S6
MNKKSGATLDHKEKFMRKYETIVIIRPSIAEEGVDAIIDRAKATIEGDNGAILKMEKWGLRKLAYLIKKEQQGYYFLMEFAGVPQAVTEMERIFKIDDRILKFMTIKLEHAYSPAAEVIGEQAAPEAAAESTEAEA